MREIPTLVLAVAASAACGGPAPGRQQETPPPSASPRAAAGTFGDDVTFLRSHTQVVLLEDGAARVAVAPEYQGRVLTSTSGGESGPSFGWINREVIAKKQRAPHMNVFGGEDRFWLGPEGGQYGLYFPKGAAFDFEHWQVPEAIDWGGWEATDRAATRVSFRKDMRLANHSGTAFDLRVDRTVSLASATEAAARLGGTVPAGVSVVAYESSNTITNTGREAWTRDKGLLSVWILGMYRPSPRTTIVLPYRTGTETDLGPVVKDDYFGRVPESRLKRAASVLYFRGDGQERGKIGIPARRARPVAGSYDAAQGTLTLVTYTLPEHPGVGYVNSMWEKQADPYGGDVVNSYNDGPPGPGQKPLGPFYEIETSSPAAALAPGRSLTHVHKTTHLAGPRPALDAIAQAQLGVGLGEIEAAFGKD